MSLGKGLEHHNWVLWVALAGIAIAQTRAVSAEPASSMSTRLATKHSSRRLSHHRSSPKRHALDVQGTIANSGDAFASRQNCIDLLKRGERVQRVAGTARIAAWNVRWFPDGVPGNPLQSAYATDLEWMACTLAYMNVDAVALAEVKSKPRSEAALVQLTQRLNELTNGKYVVRLDDCPDQNGQHLAWLLNEQRVTAVDWQTHASINPNGDACAGQLRPGLGVTLRFAGGLDLHAIAVHLKSGVEPRDIELRRQSWDAIERVVSNVIDQSGDADVLITGDLNSMGCRECPNVERSAAEAGWLDTRLRAFHPSMRRIPSDFGCSHYYQRQPSQLDHFIVTNATKEASAVHSFSVYGHCRLFQCEAYTGGDPESLHHLSDHCPIALTLRDQDLD